METAIPFWLYGCSGKIGEQVYYTRNGKTFVRKAPGSYNKNPTLKQKVSRELFKKAHLFAKEIIADPILKAQYLKKAQTKKTAYCQAVSEYLKKHKKEMSLRIAAISTSPKVVLKKRLAFTKSLLKFYPYGINDDVALHSKHQRSRSFRQALPSFPNDRTVFR